MFHDPGKAISYCFVISIASYLKLGNKTINEAKMRELNVLLKQLESWLKLALKIMNMWQMFTSKKTLSKTKETVLYQALKNVYWWTSEGSNKTVISNARVKPIPSTQCCFVIFKYLLWMVYLLSHSNNSLKNLKM